MITPEEFQSVEELRHANARLSRQLFDLKREREDYAKIVYKAAFDAASGLTIPPVKAPPKDRRRKAEVAAALVSDLQLAKVTPDYNSEVCEQRMEVYADKLLHITNIQRSDHPVRKCVVGVLGDVIEGVDIFPGQSWLIDAGLYRQIMVDGPRIMLTFFRRLLSAFDEVDVVWVIGNHGRIGRKGAFDPETNGDRMLGKLVQMQMANEPRIRITVPDGKGERNWYSVVRIGAYSALALHGDQIKGHSGFPWYGLGKKVNGWAGGSIPEPFGDVWMGHWHQIAAIPLNRRTVYVNGSTESYNTFAQENLAAMSDPAQWLLYVDPEAGQVTASYQVRLA